MSLEKNNAKSWFMEDRFGMFIHWGLYAIPGKGEWMRSVEHTSLEDYQVYFDEFNPIHYDPKKWAKKAKEAGMKYAILTAKHHDGFCLFDSALTDYKSTNTPCKRDLVKEFLDAFREEGLKVGLYYSLLDWHHEDFPCYKDPFHPMQGKFPEEEEKKDFSRYVKYLHGQVEELLTNYGKLDIMWFDYSYNEMAGEKWEATKLVRMMRSLQPDIIIDNRLGINKASEPITEYSGDFVSPEQIMPDAPMTDVYGNKSPWELCITMNFHWGYSPLDREYKSAKTIIRALVECTSKGGNLLVNVGPSPKGELPRESIQILEDMGKWIYENGESIYGCGESMMKKPDWGFYTQKGNTLYAHVFDRGIGDLKIDGMEGKLKNGRRVCDWSEAALFRPWNGHEYPDDAFIQLTTADLQDDIDTVYKFEIK
ncbi:alpha-L-fucosidase [Scatolibacter rhodanostii]|uniref:alpha-L-fucosidase n=1 Tax=Scatolibacter rhodanostii TaxID=2014781 RepID=UPI000C07D12A|nr:alpha-L-fucosidase [Scatolibacter rhodanostii]